MKKIILGIITLSATLGVVSCDNENKQDTTKEKKQIVQCEKIQERPRKW